MPAPRLTELDQAVETACFRALVAVLREDKVLARVVRTWEVLDGTNPTLEPPPTGAMPWIRVMGGPSTLVQAEAGAWGMEFHLLVTIATAGLHQDDQTNLWGALRAALNYNRPFRSTDVATYLRGAGMVLHKVSQPGFGAWPPPPPNGPSPAQDLFGSARIVLDLLIPLVD